ncbi:sensor histidine kinase [Spirosoma pollinicola]|uniref:histidine kinase n=1 Tax=Spirosoma pollinicola TaxID=2057025 RepID=A0A2K8YSR3_9BACT|nr:two-component regulator propeller domain-containing protein [Spirosoma pollinicola]AUD00650.1 histidine kinase [Spirosoma pollinicola]
MKSPFNTAVFFIYIICLPLNIIQAQSIKFNHINTNQGLSQSHVYAILKDKKGFMWFGSEDGLNKYDGYKFTQYKQDLTNKSSICNSNVQDILEDKEGNFWIATANGLDRFDRAKNKFIHYPDGQNNYNINDIFQDSKSRIWLGTESGLFLFNVHTGSYTSYQEVTKKRRSKFSATINRIIEDGNSDLWFGTDDGLYRYNSKIRQVTGYFKDSLTKNSIRSDWVKDLYKDRAGNIWIGTHGGGLSLYNRATNSFHSFQHNPHNPFTIAHNDILSIMEDKGGNLWVGTENGGISIYNPASHKFTTYKYNPEDNSSLNNNSVYCLYRDDADNIWIGTYAGGVNFVPKFGDKFVSYHQIANDANSLSNNLVLSICGASTGNAVWIGTDGGGLNLFDRKTKNFTHYIHNDKNKNSPSNDYVISVIRVSPDILGLGYHNGGFDLFNEKTGVFTHHLPKVNDSQSLSISDVNNMFRDKDGNLWIGTWKGGLNFYNVSNNSFVHYRTNLDDKTSISDDIVTTVFQDKKGAIWVGTYKGLNLLDRDRKKFRRFQHDNQNKLSISNDNVQSILGANDGNLWIGTVGGGLNYFDAHKQTFKSYTEKDGLASNVVFAIQKDHTNKLWLSTNNGLSLFDPKTETFRNFSISDGLQGNEFRDNSSYQTPDGQLFFGGVNGFSTFYPDSLNDNTFIPPVYITDFQVFNKSISVGDKDQLLQKQISETRSITLSYKQSVFTFEYSALNYTVSEKNKYAYRLEGFDKEWNYVGTKRTATYTNLDPGTYVFRVKAANNDGVWNNVGTSLTVIITPPFWLTWWFKSLMALMLLSGLYALYRLRVKGIEAQQLILQNQVLARTSEVLQQKQELQDQALYVQLLQAKVEQQAAEQQLQESEQRFREIAENVDEVFWVHSAQPFQLLYVNPAFERVLNTTFQQAQKEPFLFMKTVLLEDRPAVSAFFEQYKAGIAGQLYYRTEVKGEPLRWLMIRTFIIRNEAGEVLRHIGIANDVTDQKEKEFVLQQALRREQELNQLKSQFVSTASHEFRTPLTTIQSSTELIELYLNSPTVSARGAISKHLGVIKQEINHFTSLLTDILTIGKIESGKVHFVPNWVDIVSISKEVIETHFSHRSDNRSVQLSIEGTERMVYVDAKLINHVLINLVSNAFKFSTKSPHLRLIFSDESVVFQVIDEGIGIPVSELSNLFQPFFRASNTNEAPGTGLGLVIARQFVELNGGQLELTSEEKKGTTCTVTLKSAKANETAST